MEIILDILWFGLIFGALATGPLLTWLAISWLMTDRKRSGRPADAG